MFFTHCVLLYIFIIFAYTRFLNILRTRSRQNFAPTTLIVAAYLVNESKIIEKSLLSFQKVKGIQRIILAWNGPMPEDHLLLDRLSKMGTSELPIDIFHVSGSNSKARNINAVLSLVKDEFIVICDADDILYPNALEELFRGMKPGVWCVQGLYKIRRSSGQQNVFIWAADIFEQYTLIVVACILANFILFRGHSALFRTKVLREAKFYEKCINEDMEISVFTQQLGKIQTVGFTGECFSPPTYKAYLNQRKQWWIGGMQLCNYSQVLQLNICALVLMYLWSYNGWTVFLFTYFLTFDLGDTLVSLVGLYVFIINLPVTAFLTFKTMLSMDSLRSRPLIREPTPRS